jgi:hypothetical protein
VTIIPPRRRAPSVRPNRPEPAAESPLEGVAESNWNHWPNPHWNGRPNGLEYADKTAKHWFCQYCGIHPFSNPRAAPEMYSINIRCLDDFDLANANIEVGKFDGRNWEEAIKNFKS